MVRASSGVPLVWLVWLQAGPGAGSLGTSHWPRNRRDYLRETEDILSYEPFLGVAGPPGEDSHAPGPAQYHAPQPEQAGEAAATEPMFSGPIPNVTVNVGREAVLECRVDNLRGYKVGWLKAGDQTILALHKRVITHNSRVSVSHEDNKVWKLHLRAVVEADRGCYMCQINTERMKQQNGCLDVNVPPDIDYLQTSKDVVVQEGENVTLVCRASGHPAPRITWRREDGDTIVRSPAPARTRPGQAKSGLAKYEGENLSLARVGRAQMGAYLCIASNDVPPTVSKRISLNVNFAPEILVPNQLLGYQFGARVVAECLVEAYPNTINYWMKHQTEMLLNNDKYTVVEERTSGYSTRMQLQISNFEASDVGVYTCISTNSLGKSDGTIRFYEIPPAERITSATHANNANKVTHTTTEQIEIKFIGNHNTDSGNNGGNQESWSNGDTFGDRSKNQRHRNNTTDSQKKFRTYKSGFSSSSTQSSLSMCFNIVLLLALLYC